MTSTQKVRPGAASASRPDTLKKFTYKQIQEKVAERWQMPEYYDILMEAAVKEDEDGVLFNLKHPSFQVKKKQKSKKAVPIWKMICDNKPMGKQMKQIKYRNW
ncbi:hypothetical protein RFI_20252 [Reticulomyxa filosa]|uniref:Uncharacterized protein n=1 Tax=Reticulomyxa filosa TaxID=46433 RepID=X6MTT6_RETFI|nr:hypothetical protein RFI_20252 [Reticulomyxa filosa]|eukprot:ETO17081.1 hypothetical protein RFI_20252 [Reticulomyxa filosa]